MDPHANPVSRAAFSGRAPSVLLVSYAFPPCATAGIHRLLRNIKHLTTLGWEVSVLSAWNPIAPVYDPTLETRIPASVRCFRTPRIHFLEPFRPFRRLIRRVFARTDDWENGSWDSSVSGEAHGVAAGLRSLATFPDEANGWIPFAVPAGIWRLARSRVDVIFSSAPAWSNHLVAMALREATGIPWVAEFRDAWSENPQRLLQGGIPFLKLTRRMENRVLRRASTILTVTRTLRDHLEERIERMGGSAPVKTIYNGFEPSDIHAPGVRTKVAGRPVHLLHLGNIYADRARTRLLEGLARAARVLPPATLRIEFVGTGWEPLRGEARRLGVEPWLVFRGFVPEPEADRLLTGADALLILVGAPERGGVLSVPSKLFRYLVLGKPLVGVVPPGTEVADIVGRIGGGRVADPLNPEAIAQTLVALVNDFASGFPHIPDAAHIEGYSAQRQLDLFSGVLEGVRARRGAEIRS